MSMNNPRNRYPDRDRRGRPERRPPYYNPYPYGQPYGQCPYAQPSPYGGQQCPFNQPCPYTQPSPYAQPVPEAPPQGACPQGAMSYDVQSGDTLDNIASRLGVSPDAITAVNPNINFSVPLQNGQSICIPTG